MTNLVPLPGGRTRGEGFKLQQEGIHLQIKMSFLTMRLDSEQGT